VLPANAPAWIDRLLTWLEPFEASFGHVKQRSAFRRYLLGLLNDSPRKSMSAMLARVSDPGDYQAFQHFLTHAPWAPDPLWRALRDAVPVRAGVLIIDGTSFPKQGTQSVGVARQYCGALGKIANCQVATTVALWTGTQAWCLGARLYLPETWITPEQRQGAKIPATVRFQEKWRHARQLVRDVRATDFTITAVLADAEFGDVSALRAGWHRAGVPYAVGISSTVTVFATRPRVVRPPRMPGAIGRPRSRPTLAIDTPPQAVAALIATWPDAAWHRVEWRATPTGRLYTGHFAAQRVTPARGWRDHHLDPEVWLLAERGIGETPRTKYYFVHLPATAALQTLVELAHQRWAIEQQYQELKDELGLDHFEGRSWLGWHRHVVLTALAHTFLQTERLRRPKTPLTLPQVRAIIREILTAHFFVTRPHYLQRLLKLQQVSLRI